MMAELTDDAPEQMASPGGTLYTLKKGKGQYGYEGVTAPHGPEKGYHARPPIDMTNGKQQFIPGAACKTPEEAALRRSKFLAAPFDIVKQDPDRASKGKGKQASAKRQLEAAAQEDPEDLPAWVVSRDAFTMWQAGFEPPASMRLSAAAEAEVWRLRAWATAARAKGDAPTATVAANPPQKQKSVRVTASTVRTPAAVTSGSSVMCKRECSQYLSSRRDRRRNLIRRCLLMWLRSKLRLGMVGLEASIESCVKHHFSAYIKF